MRLGNLGGIGNRVPVDQCDEHRAHLVLDDTVRHHGAVTEIPKHDFEGEGRETEFEIEPAADGRFERLAGTRVTTAAVGEHARPRRLRPGPAGRQKSPGPVEHIAREGQVQGRVSVVDRRLGRGPDGPAVIGQQHNQFGRSHARHRPTDREPS